MATAQARRPRARAASPLALLTAILVVLGFLVSAPAAGAAPAAAETAQANIVAAADLSKFQAGNIVSDAVFFDRTTMSAAAIQTFLESKVPACQSGYTCLKDWYDSSRTTTADAMCGAYSGGSRERASTIIYKVAQACGINPQVIIVTLQKEQGLVTHTWPSEWRFRIAMGQGCPDTAACDTRYYGFFNQVYGAAWQFKRYANPPGTSQFFTWYAPGNTWNILYNPNRDCGSSPVFVQNQATANLYYYTPYQPNAAALRAGYGEGDGCSAYGNRNFYNYFTDWFGSTLVPANPCAAPSAILPAVKTYVVTADILNARLAPSTSCTKNVMKLARGTVLQATAGSGDWLRVNTESGSRWVARAYLRYATAEESPCALPPKAGTAQYAYVLTGNATGRIVPAGGCGVDSRPVAAGAIVQAFLVSADKAWLKVHLGDVDRWVERAELRRATDTETPCAQPGGVIAAKMLYTIRGEGTSGRSAPNTSCAIGRVSLSGGTVVQAILGNATRDWLKVSTGRGEVWVDRSHLTRLDRDTDPCTVLPTTRTPVRSYVVQGGPATAAIAPTTSCGQSAATIPNGTVVKPTQGTQAGDWLLIPTASGPRWIARMAVRTLALDDVCAHQPVDVLPARLTYVVLAASLGRIAPNAGCETAAVEIAAGTVAPAVSGTAAGDWLKLKLPEGEYWVRRADVARAPGT
ncbi:hypothetical protein ABZ477_12740 [Microbacterium sp. NPDC019599]|uniref:hypothetical protein n=1 Tax=Microbacterium sp. NPDC019599 TaxID=3154690 RepID=UPI0033DBEAFF